MDVSRFCKTETLKLDLEFVTPAFIGGADGKSAELRLSSFKGMIRFWWRVLYGAQYGNEILKYENEIFGSANNNAHKSNVRISIEKDHLLKTQSDSFNDSTITINGEPKKVLDYLGYGKRKMGVTENAAYILPNEKFSMIFSVSKSLSDEQIQQVFQSIVFFFRYGCIGAKSRNGYGSMNIIGQSCSIKIDKFIMDETNSIKEFSSLSKESGMYVTDSKETFETWKEVLRHIGKIYIEAKTKNANSSDERNAKEMFLHVRKLGENKYQGQILYIPRSKTQVQNIKSSLESKMKNSTDTTLKGGKK